MAQIIFNTFENYNAAKQLPLTTFVVGEPIYERTPEGLLTGRFIIDHQFTAEQLAELAEHDLFPEVESVIDGPENQPI